MRIQTIGATLLVYADQGELRRRGFRERSIGLREVLLLAREALRQAGLPMERLTEIEAFPRERSLLIFLHMAPPEREWFRFRDLPRALDAVQALMQAPTGTLAWQGCYYLSAAEPVQQAVLSEYGEPLNPEEESRLERNGTLVLDCGALGKLWSVLKKNG